MMRLPIHWKCPSPPPSRPRARRLPTRFPLWLAGVVACLLGSLVSDVHAEPPGGGEADSRPRLSVEEQAALLQRVTVTVRVTLSPDEAGAVEAALQSDADDAAPSSSFDAQSSSRPRVSVCSGVLLGDGLIVSSVYAGSDSKIRITLPGGRQADARLKVIDGYSGLVLLETDERELSGIELAAELPPVGRQILLAAAWGLQDPVVSQGIVSGVDRTLSGVSFPPLIQCDLRTAETASGAGLVDARGQLLGIVVLADQPDRRRGWTYAVPASHVRRLRAAYEGREQHTSAGSATSSDSVLVLKRRRPVVGMVLGGEPDHVVVRRVDDDSPAARAGVRVGDRIVAADGVQIRSVYQAVRPVLFKQPGDVMRYLIERDGQPQAVAVKLGGGVELPSATLENLGQFIQPKVDIEGLADGRFRTSSGRGEVREVFAGDPRESDSETDPRLVTNAQKLRLLERALDAYRNVITYQQQELGRRAEERKELEQQVRELQQKLQALEKQAGEP